MATYPVLLRLGCFVLALALLWLPLAAPLYLWLRADPNLTSIVTITLLGLLFISLLRIWGKRVHGYRSVFGQYGLVATGRNFREFALGIGLGLGFVFALFSAIALLGWAQWQSTPTLWRWVLEGSLTAIGVGIGEELCFRGWLLDELEQDYNGAIALWVNSVVFAVLHFLKPWSEIIRTFPQFPGLMLLGLILVWARRRTRYRLGQSIGLHAGLVWGYYIINVGNLIEFTGVVPDWVTGVDRNPLAGLMGIGFLGLLALWVRWGSGRLTQAR
ncbi:MAG: CPBP family intramembrane metalloprotease [Spirulina sp. SIO3F2]|nr:CPBP family intramembrane metalloprotease [Spirulina sp. SIO3F2]